MQVTININCDNAAFEDNAEGEVVRILSTISENILSYGIQDAPYTYAIKDINGNRCGVMEVKNV